MMMTMAMPTWRIASPGKEHIKKSRTPPDSTERLKESQRCRTCVGCPPAGNGQRNEKATHTETSPTQRKEKTG